MTSTGQQNRFEQKIKQMAAEELKVALLKRYARKLDEEVTVSDSGTRSNSGPPTKTEEVEVPVGGRTNHGVTEKTTLPEPSDPPTTTVEVPIEGGDVEDPATMEKEVLDPDYSEEDLTEGLSPDEMSRVNRDQDTFEDVNPEEVPVGGWRRMKEENDE